jgi:DNA-binding LacI/PurR family transcriptional regulator
LRRDGYLAALASAGLPSDPALIVQAPLTAEAAHDVARALIESGVEFDAIVAVSDVIALAAIRVLMETGRRAPDDVAVIGYDDIILARQNAPPLTTIRQDLETGARAMVDLLFRRIGGEDAPSMTMPAELIVRATA